MDHPDEEVVEAEIMVTEVVALHSSLCGLISKTASILL